MRCHYDVLEIARNASAEDIKKSYRKLSLRYHPDRNIGNEIAATESFKELSASYEVLSDPQEKKWYDDHREAILKGSKHDQNTATDGSNAFHDLTKSDELYEYFSSSCYTGYDDNSKDSFYSVYSCVFESINELEKSNDNFDINITVPLFGLSSTEDKDVLSFYLYWTNFISCLSFSFVDKYNPNDAPDRSTKRLIEKDNKKLRDVKRKEYNELIRAVSL